MDEIDIPLIGIFNNFPIVELLPAIFIMVGIYSLGYLFYYVIWKKIRNLVYTGVNYG